MITLREFALPDLGEGLVEAEIVTWLVAVGDVVVVDQAVVEVETAKATVEVPCPFAGVVSRLFGAEGDVLPVGSPMIAVMVEAAEEPGSAGPDSAGPDSAGPGGMGSGSVLVGYGTSAPSTPRARTADPPGAARPPVPVSSPPVRNLARRHGVDLGSLHGSGAGGLVLRADVTRAVEAAAGRSERLPLRGRTAVAAERFSRSRTEIPDATCWVDVDATALVETRATLAGIGILALLARICVTALAAHPRFNASVDTARGEIIRWSAVHLGVAIQGSRGLVVPVVRDAQAMTTPQLATALGHLTAAARDGGLAAGELDGSTFTLNNYGVLGVDGSTPILNHPEVAMLGVGRIVDRAWVHLGTVSVRKVVQLSFTFDHRVCDGAEAAAFLRFVADRVEQPSRLLGEL